MGKINVLAPDVRGKIAAGEVITRPNSIIKELLENSLDAGASRVEIEIEDGGKKKCLINDDGSGMSKDDALLAVERFTTSKISSTEDIENIRTYGFRGEALASIAQISHFELDTSDGTAGTKIEIMGGEVKSVLLSQRSRGTRIKVTDLFYNLPVRWKFLKSSEWERRLILDTVRVYALVKPAVSISVDESTRKLINLPGVGSAGERINLMYGHLRSHLIQFEIKLDTFTVTAFLTRPDFFEAPNVNYIFVNGRPVKYPRIYRSVIEAYHSPKNLPSFIIFIDAKPDFVDVNIHPTKNEVRFKDERYVVDILFQGIKKEIFPAMSAIESGISATQPAGSEIFVQEKIIPYENAEPQGFYMIRETPEFWQLHNTYILTQTKTGLLILDQHVAHERIIYDSILSGKAGSQRLLFPITIDLDPEEYKIYLKTRDLLNDLGIEFKEFSDRTLVIDSLPQDSRMTRDDLVGFFSEIGNLGALCGERFELAKVVACKSAIKAGQKLSPAEMQSLVDKLFACENPYTCPHGRPIVIKFGLDELASKFGR